MNTATEMSPAAPLASLRPAPVVKWVGGKRNLVAKIRSLGPERIERYHERFCGGAAMFFHLRAEGWSGQAFLSDVNRGLIRLYRAVRDQPAALIRELKRHETTEGHYKEIRAAFNERRHGAMDDVETAAWFLFLNKTCFNGLYRENSKGGMNAPWGHCKRPYVPDEAGIYSASAALQRAVLRCEAFDEVEAADARPGDFFYFDPPYIPASDTADFASYSADGFTDRDQERLRDLALSLTAAGARVVLSNADVPAARNLYGHGFEVHEVQMRRAINRDASKRGPVGELLMVATGRAA